MRDDVFTPCQPLPEPEDALWGHWAVAVPLFIAAFAPCFSSE